MKSYNYLIAALLLIACAAIAIRFHVIWYGWLVLMLLFVPLFDQQCRVQGVLKLHRQPVYNSVSVLLIVLAITLTASTANLEILIRTFFFAAVPEEWFFRVYLMTKLGGGYKANLISSLVFSLLHGITRGWVVGLLVFAPSIAYGWLYQKTRNYYVVTATHAISNIIYILYLSHLV